MPLRYPTARVITWDQYKAMIRSTDRDSLLKRAAEATALIATDRMAPDAAAVGLTPWAIGDVARTAIAWSGFNRPEASDEALARLSNAYMFVDDELRSKQGQTSLGLLEFLFRMFHEQFPAQLAVLPELSRSSLLFRDGAEIPPHRELSVIRPGWFEEVFGCSLDTYLTSVFAAFASAVQNRGEFDINWFRVPGVEDVDARFSVEDIEEVFDRHLSGTIDDFKAANRKYQGAAPAMKKKYSFNPLRERPFVLGAGPLPIAPYAQLIVGKASPASIFYSGMNQFGTAFSIDLGYLFESYIGRHLELIDAPIWPEVPYGRAKNPSMSCDFFLELPNHLVLIECKAARPVESVRMGDSGLLDALDQNLGKGIRQINATHRDFAQINLAQPELTSSKPRVGLVVTLEPFFANNHPTLREHIEQADLPLAIVSSEEFERLCTLSATEMDEAIVEALRDSRGNEFSILTATRRARENVLLTEAYEGFELMQFLRERRPPD